MDPDHVARVHEIMRRTRRSCWDLDELAAALAPDGPAADGLARLLLDDPRFRVLEPPRPVAVARHWSVRERASYGPALRRAGLAGARVVVLLGEPYAADSPASLLDRTVARLATVDRCAVAPQDIAAVPRVRRLLDLI